MGADRVIPFSSLTFDRQKSGDTVTLLCHGKVVSETAPILQQEVRALIAESKVIVVDLTDVSYMDSSGLGALVGLYVSAKRGGKQLKLVNLSDRIRELLRITNLLSIFEGYGEYLSQVRPALMGSRQMLSTTRNGSLGSCPTILDHRFCALSLLP